MDALGDHDQMGSWNWHHGPAERHLTEREQVRVRKLDWEEQGQRKLLLWV